MKQKLIIQQYGAVGVDSFKAERFSRRSTLLLLAFFVSGASGLIYQIVWIRMLTRYLGSTTSSTATVLCVFMGGLAAGAFFGGKIADRIRNHLRGYSLLEVAIAVIALLSSFTIISVLGSAYADLYRFIGDSYLFLTFVKALFSILCLFIPTLLMGATLPLLVAYLTRYHLYYQSGLARLYSINTFGAVAGVLVTGFYLIGHFGETISLIIAAALNFLAAVFARLLEKKQLINQNRLYVPKKSDKTKEPNVYSRRIVMWSRITIFFSGFTALAYEILWTRLLLLPLRTSIYAFSFMLALFLVGIAVGSWLSNRSTISLEQPLTIFGLLEVLISMLTTAGILFYTVLGLMTDGFISMGVPNFLIAAIMVLPVAIAFGWQFPIAVRCCLSNPAAPGQQSGWAYSANTIGSILGSLTAGFVLIPTVGTVEAMVALACLNIILGGILFWITPKKVFKTVWYTAVIVAAGFAAVAMTIQNPYKEIMFRKAKKYLGPDTSIYAFHEGVAGTTVSAGSNSNPRARHLFINGVGMTILVSETKLMAHLPMALVKNPKRILVICFGMGTTVRSATRFSKVEVQVDAVDIVPKVFDSFGYFHSDAAEIASKPNVRFYPEDGRNFLLLRKTLYDVITIDPAPPIHSAGTVNLYTKEFLELCKSRIRKSGAVCLWLPPSPATELFIIMKTFLKVFPKASLWGGIDYSGFYLIGGQTSFEMSADQISHLIQRLKKISDIGEWDNRFQDEKILKSLYICSLRELTELFKDVPEVSDDHPYTEFPIWRWVSGKGGYILNANEMRSYIATKKMGQSPKIFGN